MDQKGEQILKGLRIKALVFWFSELSNNDAENSVMKRPAHSSNAEQIVPVKGERSGRACMCVWCVCCCPVLIA